MQRPGVVTPLRLLYQVAFKNTTQPSAGCPGRRRGAPPASGYPGVLWEYVQECNEETTKVYE